MKRKILTTGALLCCFLVCLSAAITDISGKWTGPITTPDGNQLQLNYVFKVDGDTLTGTGQGDGQPTDIKEGKISGNDITFKVYDDNGEVIPHSGRYYPDGDSISMNIEAHGNKFHATLKRVADK
ncbi:MAG: glycoside hydrolase [Bacteroidetes bacterium]|nr:glycoside hydrolase [Bacteroidota bacterium]